jgi:riboflavin synthase
MFTGIVEATGSVVSLEARGGDRRVHVDGGALDLADARVGDSIAINGVCLTVVTLDGRTFAADVSLETLACTTLAELAPGSRVNLERALLPTTRLGGHLVSGHVDGVGVVRQTRDAGRSREIVIAVPEALARYIATKGSVCVDGVSLTVNAADDAEFSVNIIPHTLERTNIGAYRAGSRVNIEVDVIARYLERLLAAREEPPRGIDRAFLTMHGYLDDAG